MTRLRLAAAGVALSILLAGGCRKAAEVRGILLVTLDTTRADHLGCYGFKGASTPHLDALASGSVRFDRAFAPIPMTLPSHASMFTGLYPPRHGVRYNGIFRLASGAVTVAELLRDAGWTTAAVPASYTVAASSGLGQGFETYRDLYQEPDAKNLPANAERKADDVARIGADWLRSHRESRFFLWLQFFDPHDPYEPPFPYSAQFRERPYDGEIAFVDAELGKVLAALRETGRDNDTLIVVAGDHGEGLYEHGEKTHSNLVYDTTLHVPLLVREPGGRASRICRDPVSLVDVTPTLLDYAGVAIPEGLDGISLRQAVAGKAIEARDLYFEAQSGAFLYGWSPLEGIRRGQWKLIRSGGFELFDTDADPGEKVDVHSNEAGRVGDLSATLESFMQRWSDQGKTGEAALVPLEPEAVERLASLGYVGGAVSMERRAGPRPKDLVHLEGDLILSRDMMDAKEYAQALGVMERILKADPGNRLALLESARAWQKVGDLDRAARTAEELLRRFPEFDLGTNALTDIEIQRGNPGKAVEAIRESLKYHPGKPDLTYRLALALASAGRVEEAAREVDAALGRKPGQATEASFLVARAMCRARLGDPVGARAALASAIAEGYDDRGTLESEPMLAPLRAVPGFREELAKIKAGKP